MVSAEEFVRKNIIVHVKRGKLERQRLYCDVCLKTFPESFYKAFMNKDDELNGQGRKIFTIDNNYSYLGKIELELHTLEGINNKLTPSAIGGERRDCLSELLGVLHKHNLKKGAWVRKLFEGEDPAHLYKSILEKRRELEKAGVPENYLNKLIFNGKGLGAAILNIILKKLKEKFDIAFAYADEVTNTSAPKMFEREGWTKMKHARGNALAYYKIL